MSTLTGQQIKDTYEGLLKLADSTTGITSTYQQIQDGLGNDTNTKISSIGILSPTIPGLTNQLLKADYYGTGIGASASANVANTQNRVLYFPFYDTGIYDYSAVTYVINTLTSTSDVVDIAFYTPQIVPNFGIAPKDLILSGVTLLSTGTTGLKTTTLPSTLSFSGTGGGFYIIAFYVSNGGVTPTIRYNLANTPINQSFSNSLGFQLNLTNNASIVGQKAGIAGGQSMVLNLPFQTTYTESDISNNLVPSISNQTTWGILLNTIR